MIGRTPMWVTHSPYSCDILWRSVETIKVLKNTKKCISKSFKNTLACILWKRPKSGDCRPCHQTLITLEWWEIQCKYLYIVEICHVFTLMCLCVYHMHHKDWARECVDKRAIIWLRDCRKDAQCKHYLTRKWATYERVSNNMVGKGQDPCAWGGWLKKQDDGKTIINVLLMSRDQC